MQGFEVMSLHQRVYSFYKTGIRSRRLKLLLCGQATVRLLSQMLTFTLLTHNSGTLPISPAALKEKKAFFHAKKTKGLEKTVFLLFLCSRRSRNSVFPFLERALNLSTSKALKAKFSNQSNE